MFKKVMGVSPSKYKRFYYLRYSPNKENYQLITDNLIKLNTLIGKINEYRQKRKPVTPPVRKLSIFK